MKNDNQRKNEQKLQKALAIEYARSYCINNNLSVEKLENQRFFLLNNECAFAQPSNVKPDGLINDKETMPKVTLIIRFENEKLAIQETEYTKLYLQLE